MLYSDPELYYLYQYYIHLMFLNITSFLNNQDLRLGLYYNQFGHKYWCRSGLDTKISSYWVIYMGQDYTFIPQDTPFPHFLSDQGF